MSLNRNMGSRDMMMRGFIVGVIAVIVIGLICAYGLLQSGLVPANADA